MTTVKMNPVLKKVWFTPKRLKIVHGGRSSSKSYDFASALAFMGSQIRLKIVVARQFQNSIAQSAKSLIENRIEAMGMASNYDFQRTVTVDLLTGTEYLYYGIARNLIELKSLDGVDILVIEEAGKLTAEQWAIIEPTIRKEGSEVWLIFNPDLATDFVWSLVTNPPEDCIVVQINHDQNPFLSETMKKVIKNAKLRMPPEEYDHIYGGVPRTNDQLSFIKSTWLRACVDFHTLYDRPGIADGEHRLGLDLADAGDDTSALAESFGCYLHELEEWRSDEDQLLQSIAQAYHVALDKEAILVPDVIGIGASAIPKIMEMNEARITLGLDTVEHGKFHAGERPSENDYMLDTTCDKFFTNKKAEAWGLLSDRARNTFVLRTAIEAGKTGLELPTFEDHELFSINGEIECLEKLILELSSPRKVIDMSGKVMCEKKSDMLKRGVKSPNLADATIIALYPDASSQGFFD